MSRRMLSNGAAVAALVLVGLPMHVQGQVRLGTETRSVADGPWSGEIVCVLSTRGTNYQEDQTQRWRLTGERPEVKGATRLWPAVWSVQGRGTKGQESWTIDVAAKPAPLAIYETLGPRGNNGLRIDSQHGQLNARDGIRVAPVPGVSRSVSVFPVWELGVPTITVDSAATVTTISDSWTRPGPPSYAWQPASDAKATETCKWRFTRTDSELSRATGSEPSASSAASGRIATGSGAVVPAAPSGSAVAGLSRARSSDPAAGGSTTSSSSTPGSNPVFRALTPGGPPVSGLRAQVTATSVALRWSCPPGASGYDVSVVQNGAAPVQLTTTPLSANCVQDLELNTRPLQPNQLGATPQTTYSTGFTHTGLLPATEFVYTVRALYPTGDPAESAPFPARTNGFPPPPNVSVSKGAPGNVEFSWNQSKTPTAAASAYAVSRKLSSESSFRTVATVPSPGYSYTVYYTDGGVPAGRYEYVIRAVDGDPTPTFSITVGVPELYQVGMLNLFTANIQWLVWPGASVRLMSAPLVGGPWTDMGIDPASNILRFLVTPGTRAYYKVVATYPGVTLESDPAVIDVPQWTPITNLVTWFGEANFIDLTWDCEPGVAEYQIFRLWNGGQRSTMAGNAYPAICNFSDRKIPPEIDRRTVEYIVVALDRQDRMIRASRIRPTSYGPPARRE